jgi:glycosyltransferase involved in cell wall biosynthesis
MDLEVLYCSGESGTEKFDAEFGQKLAWDIPLLDGYPHRFLKNKGSAPVGSKKFFSLYNPGIIPFLFKRKKSTLVIHSWQYATDWLAIIFGKMAGHRIALWTETNGAQEQLKSGWKQSIKKLFLRLLFLFVNEYRCIGPQNRAFYLGNGVAEKKLRFTPYSVDNERFRQAALSLVKSTARLQLGLPATAFIILYSGKYISKKRPMDLLEAFSSLESQDAFLLMVGEGALRGEMENFIDAHHLEERVKLTGFVNQSEIPLYYKAADLFVMCSGPGETWGLSVNEAMNFGLPVLLSGLTGCSADLVEEGKNGYVFSTGNTGELATRLNEMMALPVEEREAMGRRSVEIVERHCFDEILRGIMEPALPAGRRW